MRVYKSKHSATTTYISVVMDLEINAKRVLSNQTDLMLVTYTCMFLMTLEHTDLVQKSLFCFHFFCSLGEICLHNI